MQSTVKLYFQLPYKSSCQAIVEEISAEKTFIRLNQTLAFPEGGGQVSDSGFIVTPHGVSIPFSDVQKVPGRNIFLPDFPAITVDNPIRHFVPIDSLENVEIGMNVCVRINVAKRASISVYHSAAHLVFMAVGQIRPEAIESVKGCSIREDGARFDFFVKERFSESDIAQISSISNDYVKRNIPIEVYPHQAESEAWFWKCDNVVIPCGGTHVPFTGLIGGIHVKRRRMAKNLERILVSIPDLKVPTELYET